MSIEPLAGISEPVSSLSHLAGALGASLAAIPLLRRARGDRAHLLSLGAFAGSAILLFSVSGAYHAAAPGTEARFVLQRLDHAAIWILIAGTFTPIHGILFQGPWRWGFLAAVWGLAGAGIVVTSAFLDQVPGWTVLLMYLGYGWLGAVTGVRVRRILAPEALRWLYAGGIVYSVGAAIELTGVSGLIPGVVGHHELFHLLVLVGAACHYRLVALVGARSPTRVTDASPSITPVATPSPAQAHPRPPAWTAAGSPTEVTFGR